jgi:hypothetical protein
MKPGCTSRAQAWPSKWWQWSRRFGQKWFDRQRRHKSNPGGYSQSFEEFYIFEILCWTSSIENIRCNYQKNYFKKLFIIYFYLNIRELFHLYCRILRIVKNNIETWIKSFLLLLRLFVYDLTIVPGWDENQHLKSCLISKFL